MLDSLDMSKTWKIGLLLDLQKICRTKCPWHNDLSNVGEFGQPGLSWAAFAPEYRKRKWLATVRRSGIFPGLHWNSWALKLLFVCLLVCVYLCWYWFLFNIKEIGSDLLEILWLMKNSQSLDVLHIPDLCEHSHQSPCHRAGCPTEEGKLYHVAYIQWHFSNAFERNHNVLEEFPGWNISTKLFSMNNFPSTIYCSTLGSRSRKRTRERKQERKRRKFSSHTLRRCTISGLLQTEWNPIIMTSHFQEN